MDLSNLFDKYKESELYGRYITQDNISGLINQLNDTYKVETIGYSEFKKEISLITVGKGKKKILMWSQMHGNESTTTKALFDLFNTINDTNEQITNTILEECTLYIIPMLNPDGSQLYTRVNQRKVDLNRDAQDISQSEMKTFLDVVHKVKPDLALNLHGQRTIFSAGETNNSAIISFLSPASDEKRTITESRKKGMRIISEMNNELQKNIPNCIGRYDDGFNINCTGDTLENLGYTTILFEAGHYPNDYDREVTRKYIYISLIKCLDFFANNIVKGEGYENYFNIPENGKCFKDIIFRNVKVNNTIKDISIQYLEKLEQNKVVFVPRIAQIESQITDFGHVEYDVAGLNLEFSNDIDNLRINDEIAYFTLEDEKFSVFPIKKYN